MSSREIAELTGKRHPDVRRDIRTMLEAIDVGVSRFAHTYLDQQNKAQEEYRLPKKLTLLLVSGYDVILRLKIIDRLEELETQGGFAIPHTYADALRLAADLAEQTVVQEKEIKRMAPKERAQDQMAKSDNSHTITNAARELNITRSDLVRFLKQERWVYSRGRKLVAYVGHIRQGTLEPQKSDPAITGVLITDMGLQRLARRFSKMEYFHA